MRLIILLIVLACGACASSQESKDQQLPIATNMVDQKNTFYSRTDTSVLNVSDAEWKRVLPDSVYAIAREAGTERAFTGKYWDHEGLGTYRCAVCGNALFRSDSKFGSGCGWPSFFEPLRENGVVYHEDTSHGMVRTEVRCGRCASHLGHVFDDGPAPTHKRFCMNSLVLDLEPDESQPTTK